MTGMLAWTAQHITWIRVDKPQLDLVRLILSSLLGTAVLTLVAAVLGTALGLTLILRRRRPSSPDKGILRLGLDNAESRRRPPTSPSD